MQDLFSGSPTAAQATEAAIQFGQNDDITVVTLTRQAFGKETSNGKVESNLAASLS